MRTCAIIVFLMFIAKASYSQEKHWISPDFVQLQYAGSIGYLSAGAGYDVFKNKWRLSFNFGHVPQSRGGVMNIFSTRLMWVPKVYQLSEKTTLTPYDIGLMISYHLGSDFRSRWPEHRYPENYYWWQTSFRFHLNWQPGVTFKLREHTMFKAVTPYLDVNTNELYLVSYIQNRHALSFHDIIRLGIGARFRF